MLFHATGRSNQNWFHYADVTVERTRARAGSISDGSREAGYQRLGHDEIVVELWGAQKRPFAVTLTQHVEKLVDINFEHLYGLVTLFGHPTGP